MRFANRERSGAGRRQRRSKGRRLPRPLSYRRPTFQRLEDRLALTTPTVVGVEPLANAHVVSESTDVTATFDQTLNASSVSDQTLAVHGTQSGQFLGATNSFSATGSQAVMTLGANEHFLAGELVQATATDGIQSATGDPASPYVWQFRVAATGGSGYFEDQGERFAHIVGTDVALGDLDGDGDLDAFAVGRGANQVLLNDGSGVFVSNGQALGNSESHGVALDDLDGDGDLDAFVVGVGRNRVWFNDGSGHFVDSGRSYGNADSRGVALGDLNGDGAVDAFVANAVTGGAPNKVWINDGSGHFTDRGQNVGSLDSQDVALADLDGDGDLDAFVVNDGFLNNQPDKVWLNDGTGIFVDSLLFLGDWGSLDVALADVNGDNRIDAVTVGAENHVWLNTGSTPLFEDSGQDLGNSISQGVAVEDFNGDGAPDIFIVKSSGLGGAPNVVWRNNGDGSFFDTGQRLGNSTSTAVAAGDLDGDNDIDVFVGNEGVVETEASQVWKNNGSAVFSSTTQNVGFPGSLGVALADLDGDHDLDALVGEYGAPNQVWIGDGKGGYFNTGQNLGGSKTTAVALGDLNGDGHVDAFVANRGNQPNEVWINNGDGKARFTDSGQRLGRNSSVDVALGDVDGDGDLDAIVANGGSQASRVWFNDGHGQFSDMGSTLGTSDSTAVELGDLDGDGDLDAFITNWGGPNAIWSNNGQGQFSLTNQALGSSNSWDVALGDLDGDGDLDALVANRSGQADRIWINHGSTWADSGQTLGGMSSYAVTLGDLDGDGDLDAFIAGDAFLVWMNDNGDFTPLDQDLAAQFGRAVALGDVDGDGDLDAWTGFVGDASRLWMNLDSPPIRPDAFEPNDSSAAAANVDAPSSSLTDQLLRVFESLTVHEEENDDWYVWTAPEDGVLTVDLLFSHNGGDLDMDLYNSGMIRVDTSSSITDNERVTHDVSAGEKYFIKVVGHARATQADYDLIIRGSEYPPDSFENATGNDSIDTASNLGSQSQTHTGLTLHNPGNTDWFKITPAAAGTLQVDVTFSHLEGDVDVTLVASNGSILRSSESVTNNEHITWQVTAGQSYYVHVFGAGDATSPAYELKITAPNSSPLSADIIDVTPDPRAGAVGEISIVFSRPITDFDMSDLTLTRSNNSTVSLLPGSATLTSVDNVTWRLGNLTGLTSTSGIYELTIAAGTGGMSNGVTEKWINGAGDSDLNREFNQIDLIAVLQARKYLSGEAATWGQGDWDGDGLFDQRDIILVQQTRPPHYLQGPFAAETPAAASDTAADMRVAGIRGTTAGSDGIEAAPQAGAPGPVAAADTVYAQVDYTGSDVPEITSGLVKPAEPDDRLLDAALSDEDASLSSLLPS